jgi:hypothetical protein
MNFDGNNLPPLEPQEAPWNDVEIHVRETLLQAEAAPPAGLEAGVFASLDGAGKNGVAQGEASWKAWAWGAALVSVSVLALTTWEASRTEGDNAPSGEPTATQPVWVSEPHQEPSTSEANVGAEPESTAVQVDQTPAAVEANSEDTDEVFIPVERMEALGERGIQGLEGAQVAPELRLQQGEFETILERRPATLEVKQ